MSQGIAPAEFRTALGQFFSLAAVKTAASGHIQVISVEIEGVRGSRGADSRRRERYRLLIDVTRMRLELPRVWVLDPKDTQIGHVNIYRAGDSCPLLAQPLPSLCWGTYPTQWSQARAEQRTLLALLQNVHQHLNNPNPDSPAR